MPSLIREILSYLPFGLSGVMKVIMHANGPLIGSLSNVLVVLLMWFTDGSVAVVTSNSVLCFCHLCAKK